MTIIKIQKNNKQLLKEYGNGSFNKIVNQLITEVGDMMPDYNNTESIPSTIRLNDSTLELLESYKVISSESYESVILRLLFLAKDLNSKEE